MHVDETAEKNQIVVEWGGGSQDRLVWYSARPWCTVKFGHS